MKISELLKTRKPCFSFEFFPPKTEEDVKNLLATAKTLEALRPTFISVTWGAGGGTRRKTIDLVCQIKETCNVEAMAHLTCVGASKSDLATILKELRDRKVENILALRGDPPKDQPHFVPHPDGFRHAAELVRFIRAEGDFCIGVAGYPEGHIECPDKEADLGHLQEKVAAGADFIITQLFFDNNDFFSFVQRAQARGIAVPILPGIMPVTNFSQTQRFTKMCGAKIPPALSTALEPIQHDTEAVVRAGIDYGTKQCRELLAKGARGIHFYTLNRSHSTAEILKTIQK